MDKCAIIQTAVITNYLIYPLLYGGTQMNRAVTLLVLLLTALLLSGCAGLSNSTQPSFSQSVSNPGGNNHALWGFWHITINPDNMNAEITPIRSAEFTCNITQFLQPPISPTHMLSIEILPSSTPATGFLAIEVTINHPFPSLPKFRGFDVRGILFSDGQSFTGYEGLVYAGDGDTRLLNPDGWTRWWNPMEFTSFETIFGYTQGKLAPPNFPTAILNGYKYFSDDLDPDENIADLDPSTRGSFSNSAVNTRRYDIQFRMDDDSIVFDFNYAVDASWSKPDTAFEPDYPLEAFDLSANCREAYWIETDFAGSTAWYSSLTAYGGDLHIALEIGDWDALADGITVPDQISGIWVESFELGFIPLDVLPIATASDGNGVTTSVFTFDILNVEPSGVTDQTILVSVIASNPENYKPQLPTGDSFDYPDEPLMAYMFFDVPILDYPPIDPLTVISIVPDTCGLDTGDLPVQITGTDFAADAFAELVKNDDPLVVLDASGEVVSPDGTTIDCTFSMDSPNGAEVGVYHVVVTNPGPPPLSGQLDDGFTIYSGSTCDEAYETLLYSGTLQANGSNREIAFNRNGLLLATSGSHLYGYDVSQDGSVTGTEIIHDMMYGNENLIRLAKIDVDDFSGNILYCVSCDLYDHQNEIIAYTETGTLIGIIDNENTSVVCCMDTDVDGTLWTVGRTGGTVYINRYTWDGVQYNYDAVGSINATPQFSGMFVYECIFDCAVSYVTRKLLLVIRDEPPRKGRLICYDISTGIPEHEYSLSQFLPASTVNYAMEHFSFGCDIEIDHSTPSLEYCRVLIMEQILADTRTVFVKMDVDGNILDIGDYADQIYFSIAINPVSDDPDGPFLVGNWNEGLNSKRFDVYATPPGW